MKKQSSRRAQTSAAAKQTDTFFGVRKAPNQIKRAKNMYDMIKCLNLGNLSGPTKIPEFYVRCLLDYIIQISKAMSHAHKHDLVHGSFSLSKILAQSRKTDNKDATRIDKVKNTSQCKRASTLKSDQRHGNYNFMVTNFEPFEVLKMMRKYTQEDNTYMNLFKLGNMKLDYRSVL